jgi:serine/threonine protein kinase
MTTSKRWQQVEDLFHTALTKKGSEREEFLSEACALDSTVRLEVEELIAAYERTGPTDRPLNYLLADLVEETSPSLTPGQLIDHYRVIELIGKGGMGIVYKAQDVRLERTVAIKVFSKLARGKLNVESEYLLEARAGSAINHPNIVTIHEIGETPDITYIVMEYVEAQSLSELINSRSLNSEQILSIALQVCEALAEVHSRRIIHRDVKPANVMVNARGQVKLLDFGIARPFHTPVLQPNETRDPVAQAGTGGWPVRSTICRRSRYGANALMSARTSFLSPFFSTR